MPHKLTFTAKRNNVQGYLNSVEYYLNCSESSLVYAINDKMIDLDYVAQITSLDAKGKPFKKFTGLFNNPEVVEVSKKLFSRIYWVLDLRLDVIGAIQRNNLVGYFSDYFIGLLKSKVEDGYNLCGGSHSQRDITLSGDLIDLLQFRYYLGDIVEIKLPGCIFQSALRRVLPDSKLISETCNVSRYYTLEEIKYKFPEFVFIAEGFMQVPFNDDFLLMAGYNWEYPETSDVLFTEWLENKYAKEKYFTVPVKDKIMNLTFLQLLDWRRRELLENHSINPTKTLKDVRIRINSNW